VPKTGFANLIDALTSAESGARVRVRVCRPGYGRGEPPASEPAGTALPGRSYPDPPQREVDGPSPQPPSRLQLPSAAIQN
jgi:hypothetical protein